MAISETVQLKDGVSAPANAAAAAVNKLAAALRAVASVDMGSGKSTEIAAIARAAAAGKIDETNAKASAAVRVNMMKAEAQAQLSQQKAVLASQLQGQKGVQASQLSQQKAVQQAVLAAQKSVHAQRLADVKGEQTAATSAVKAETTAKVQAAKQKLSEEEKIAKKLSTFDAEKHRSMQQQKTRLKELGEIAVHGETNAAKAARETANEKDKAARATVSAHAQTASNSAQGHGDAMAESMASTVSGMALSLAAKAASAAKQMAEMGMAAAISAVTFRASSLDALKAMGMGEGKAAGMFEQITSVGRKIGLGKEQAMIEFRRLLASGYKADQIPKIMESIANADKGRAGGGQKLEKMFETIKAKGGMDKGVLNKLSTQFGISQSEVLKAISAKTGKTTDQIKLSLKKGTIDADTSIGAITDSIEKRFGGLAKKGAESIPGLILQIKEQFDGLFEGVNIAPLKNFLKTIRDMFDSAVGKDLKAAVGTLFSAIFGTLFGSMSGKDAGIKNFVKGIADGIRFVAAVITAVKPVVSAFVTGLLAGFQQVFGTISKGSAKNDFLGGLKTVIPLLVPMFMNLGKAAAYVMAFLGALFGIFAWGVATAAALAAAIVQLGVSLYDNIGMMVTGAISLVTELWDSITSIFDSGGEQVNGSIMSTSDTIIDTITSTLSEWAEAGVQMMEGLIQGIEDGAAGVIEAVVSVCSSAIAAARAILNINSPSRVFAEIGGSTAEGMAGGIADGTGAVTGAATKMGTAAANAAVVPGKGGAAANDNAGDKAGAGAGTYIAHLEIHANDAAGGKEAAEAFKKEMNATVRRVGNEG